jgi:hypothetical protein
LVWIDSPFVVPSAMSSTGVAVMIRHLAVEWARLHPMTEGDDDWRCIREQIQSTNAADRATCG